MGVNFDQHSQSQRDELTKILEPTTIIRGWTLYGIYHLRDASSKNKCLGTHRSGMDWHYTLKIFKIIKNCQFMQRLYLLCLNLLLIFIPQYIGRYCCTLSAHDLLYTLISLWKAFRRMSPALLSRPRRTVLPYLRL